MRGCMALAAKKGVRARAKNFATLLITNHDTEARNNQRVSIQNVLLSTKPDGIVVIVMDVNEK